MKKLILALLSLSVLAVFSTAALAESGKEGKGCCKTAVKCKDSDAACKEPAVICKETAAQKDPTAQSVVIDPVCGMDVSVKDAKYSYKYKDKTYYFCSKSCMNSFSKDPSKFIGKEPK